MKKIYVYQGTFDPFHRNHHVICEWCLKQDDTESLFIHVNYQASGSEPLKQPASWETRSALVQSVFASSKISSKVIVASKGSFSETLRQIKQRYPDRMLIQVIGSDVIANVKQRDEISGYLLVVRQEDPEDYKTLVYLNDRPVYCFPKILPSISSTQVRHYLCQNDFNSIARLIPPSVLTEIRQYQEYNATEISHRRLLIENVLLEKLRVQFNTSIALECEEKHQGLSGAKMLSIVDQSGATLAFCKIFMSQVEAKQEYDAYMVYQSHHIRTPNVYFMMDNVLCLEKISGHMPVTEEEFKKVGEAYRKLHGCQWGEAVVYPLKPNLKSILSEHFSKNIEVPVEKIYAQLLERYKRAPHEKNLIHGDAQPSNIFIAEGSGEVVFIDMANCFKCSDKARDVYQMVSSIFWREMREPNGSNCIDSVTAFLEGHGLLNPTPQALFWQFYWLVRSLDLAYQFPDHPVSAEIHQYAITAIEVMSSDWLVLNAANTVSFWHGAKRSENNIFSELAKLLRKASARHLTASC